MADNTPLKNLEHRTITVYMPDRHRRRYVKPQTVAVEVLVDPSVDPVFCPDCDGIRNYDKLEGYGCCCNWASSLLEAES